MFFYRSSKNPVIIATSFLIAGSFFVGCSPLFVRLSEIGPIATAFFRVGLACPLFAIWHCWESRPSIWEFAHLNINLKQFAIATLAGCFFAGDLAFWHLSIVNTSIANATLLANLAPIYVTIGVFFIHREVPSKAFLVGMLFAYIGAVFLLGSSFSLDPENLKGDVFGLITGFFFGAYILTVRYARLKQSTALVMTSSTLVSALLLLLITLAVGEDLAVYTFEGWFVLLGLAIISQCFGQGLIASALNLLPASFSAVTLTLEAVFAAALAWIFFGEDLSFWQCVGAIIIILGITIANKRPQDLENDASS